MKPQQLSELPTFFEVELRQVDRVRGRARRYHVSKARSLFGEAGLLITWGRIGSRARVRLETFASEAELTARWRELITRRTSHGYSAVGGHA
jgi:predicted DNA-binding WGR domain protein